VKITEEENDVDVVITIEHVNLFKIYFFTEKNKDECVQYRAVRHVTGWDKDYLRKIPRVVW
jgi:hypothetical protein